MIEGLPQDFSNLIMSLSFIHVDDLYKRNYIRTNDYLHLLLNHILDHNNAYIHSRNIPPFFMTRIFDLIEHYNIYHYKSELILEKLLYLTFYNIQNRKNIKILFDNILEINYYDKLKKIHQNLDVVRPNIKNFMNMILLDIEDYLNQNREYTYTILNNEIHHLPHDIIKIIVGYMSNLQILQICEIF